MTRSDAIKKLGKLLGKSLGYRVDPDAPSADEREEARLAHREVIAAKKTAEEAMSARRSELLQGDPEYQRLHQQWKDLRDKSQKLGGQSSRYKFTVGTSGDLFFHVKAQGDSWEEVIAKLEQRS